MQKKRPYCPDIWSSDDFNVRNLHKYGMKKTLEKKNKIKNKDDYMSYSRALKLLNVG